MEARQLISILTLNRAIQNNDKLDFFEINVEKISNFR